MPKELPHNCISVVSDQCQVPSVVVTAVRYRRWSSLPFVCSGIPLSLIGSRWYVSNQVHLKQKESYFRRSLCNQKIGHPPSSVILRRAVQFTTGQWKRHQERNKFVVAPGKFMTRRVRHCWDRAMPWWHLLGTQKPTLFPGSPLQRQKLLLPSPAPGDFRERCSRI